MKKPCDRCSKSCGSTKAGRSLSEHLCYACARNAILDRAANAGRDYRGEDYVMAAHSFAGWRGLRPADEDRIRNEFRDAAAKARHNKEES